MLHVPCSGGRALRPLALALLVAALGSARLSAQIVLTKTVGTTPGVCGAESSITVPVGTTVYFCYRVQNLSSDLLMRHDLSDDLLGQTALDFYYLSIASGEVGQVILPWVATASAVSKSTWTSFHATESWNGCANEEIQLSASGPGSPYPSSILVDAPLLDLLDVQVDLLDVTHDYADDLDLLLVPPAAGPNPVVLLSDVGGFQGLSVVDIRLEDRPGLASLPDGPGVAITSGTYAPTNYGAGDTFPAPAPAGVDAPPAGRGRLVQRLTRATGVWSLYAVDDAAGFSGSIANWCLTIWAGGASDSVSATASVDVTGPALAVDPGSVALRVVAGEVGTAPLAVANGGSQPLDWQIGEAGGALWSGAVAEPTFYTDRSSFEAAYPNLVIEDFEDTKLEDGFVTLSCRAPLAASTSSACVAVGAIAPGLELRDDPLNEAGGGYEYGVRLFGAGYLAHPSDFLVASNGSDALELVFAPPVPAVGLALTFGDNVPGTLTLQLLDAEDEEIATTTAAAGPLSAEGSFWGAGSEVPIARLRISSADGTSFGVDDIAFGTACDDPQEIPWLSVSPLSGTAPAGGASAVEATVDTSSLAPGIYTANLCVDGNGLNTQRVVVPVRAEVFLVDVFGDDFETGNAFEWSSASP